MYNLDYFKYLQFKSTLSVTPVMEDVQANRQCADQMCRGRLSIDMLSSFKVVNLIKGVSTATQKVFTTSITFSKIKMMFSGRKTSGVSSHIRPNFGILYAFTYRGCDSYLGRSYVFWMRNTELTRSHQ